MHRNLLLNIILIMVLSACAQQAVEPSDSSKDPQIYTVGEKCENAKYQLDKSIEEGQRTDLRELKRNIELHCLWRRN